ncbi:MAG TPA: YsnF/AvaK domain-containing protein [Crinalium sp.]
MVDDNKSPLDKPPFDPTDSNPDPITKEPGAHPVGTGIGAAGAGAIGAAVGGAVAGPIGAVVGGAIGAIGGGLFGKKAAESVNPTIEDEYWRTNYSSRPYVESGRTYDDYQPAYRTGYEGYRQYASTGRSYEEIEPELQRHYETNRTSSGLAWGQAKDATRDAWDRIQTMAIRDENDRPLPHEATVDRNPESVKLYEERLVADKHREKAGEVVLGKRVETETKKVSVPVEKERVVVEHVPTAQESAAIAPDANPFDDNQVARMEVYEEVPDISKTAYVREQVNVRKVADQELIHAEDQLRREELDVDAHGNSVVDKRLNS